MMTVDHESIARVVTENDEVIENDHERTEHNEMEFKIDRFFAALKPVFENNMLTEREFTLPEEISAFKSDLYDHNFITITSNVYTKSSKMKLNSPDRSQCVCKVSDNCGDSCLNRAMNMECVGDLCQCGENCQNQNIQKQMNAPVDVFRTKDKGYGIKAISPINKGSFIMEYTGEVITKDEYETRLAMHYSNDTNFYCISLEKGYVIDSRNMGNLCRFVNHSCLPNCHMQKWKVDGFVRLALYAMKNIEMGEELTWDYDFTWYGSSSPQLCFCGTHVCKKIIGQVTNEIPTENIEGEQSIIEPFIESTADEREQSTIEPFIKSITDKHLSGYRIPKLKPIQSFEPPNPFNYSRDAAGIFRVERSKDISRRIKSPSHGQGYLRDSAGTYRVNNFRQRSKKNNHNSNNRNKMNVTANSNRVPNFSKGSKNQISRNQNLRAQNHRTQTIAAAGSNRLEYSQRIQNDSDVHENTDCNSVSINSLRRVSSLE